MTNGADKAPKIIIEDQRTPEEKKKEEQEKGCAVLFLLILGLCIFIVLCFTVSCSIAIVRHDPKTPWIVLGPYYGKP